MRVLRLEVSLDNVYITNQFQTTSSQGERLRVTVNSKEENSEGFCPNYIQEFGLSRSVSENYVASCHRTLQNFLLQNSMIDAWELDTF